MDYKVGMSFTAKIEGEETSGLIQIEGGRVYLCQNEREGSDCNDKLGYKYSWIIESGCSLDLRRHDVTEFEIIDSKGKPKLLGGTRAKTPQLFKVKSENPYLLSVLGHDLQKAGFEIYGLGSSYDNLFLTVNTDYIDKTTTNKGYFSKLRITDYSVSTTWLGFGDVKEFNLPEDHDAALKFAKAQLRKKYWDSQDITFNLEGEEVRCIAKEQVVSAEGGDIKMPYSFIKSTYEAMVKIEANTKMKSKAKKFSGEINMKLHIDYHEFSLRTLKPLYEHVCKQLAASKKAPEKV